MQPNAIRNQAAAGAAASQQDPYSRFKQSAMRWAGSMDPSELAQILAKKKQGPVVGRTGGFMPDAQPPISMTQDGSAPPPLVSAVQGDAQSRSPVPPSSMPPKGGYVPSDYSGVGPTPIGSPYDPRVGASQGDMTAPPGTYYSPQSFDIQHSPASPIFDPASGNYALAMNAADRGDNGNVGDIGGGKIIGGSDGGGGTTTPNPIGGGGTSGHTPNTPGFPSAGDIPGRRRGVDPTLPMPNPAPVVTTPQQPVNWEEINATTQRWRQGAIAAGRQDIADQVTPLMIQLYRGNEMGMDPVKWLDNGGAALVARYIAANPQGGNIPQGIKSFDEYQPKPYASSPGPSWMKNGVPVPPPTPPTTPPPDGGGTPPPAEPPVAPPPPMPGSGVDPIDAVRGDIDPQTGMPRQQQPPPDSTGGDGVPPLRSPQDLAQILRGYLNPAYKQGQDALRAQLEASAATNGDLNASGFNSILGKQEGALIANQDSDFANKLMTAREGDLNRHVQKYGIDATAKTEASRIASERAIADMNNATTRLGIDTNDKLQRWLNDANSNTLQKYGIDQNTLLEKYKAELAKKGIEYSADRQVDAAALHAAAASAAAAAQSNASLMEAQMRLALGQAQLKEQGREFDLGQNLDWGKLGASIYGIDSTSQLGWLNAISNMGLNPSDLLKILQGFTPGSIYIP